jgi:hypothetical protein
MTDKGIRLHEKHGVNPTIPLCFWCGEEKNEIVLLGAAYKGEAPKNMLIDHEPCDACKARMAQGIALIEATPDSEGKPKFTGRWAVVREEAIEHIFTPGDTVARVLKHRKAFMEPEAFTKMFGERETLQ